MVVIAALNFATRRGAEDPAAYYPSPENQIFIGDYQDSWWWTFSDQYGNRFNACWVEQTGSTTGDIYVTGISSEGRIR